MAHVAVIEFQKRGAPHMHLLIWIENFDETFDIDQIIKTKVVNKKTQYFVSWKGYPASFNSWVPKESIILK